MKVNSDSAFIKQARKTGIGVIVWDENGDVIETRAHAVSDIGNPLEAEGLALKKGMKVSLWIGKGKVIFESDSVNLVEVLWCSKICG